MAPDDLSIDPFKPKFDNIFALSSNVKIPKTRERMEDEPPMSLEENKFSSPKHKHINLLNVKARVNSNNHGLAKNEYGHSIYQSPLTYVLMKGQVKSTFNYIVDNLHTYASPLFSHVSKQQSTTLKTLEHKQKEQIKPGRKILMSPLKKSETGFPTMPLSLTNKLTVT